ncbi:hypothetical protein GCM10027194_36450 [Thalassiella azotivora]
MCHFSPESWSCADDIERRADRQGFGSLCAADARSARCSCVRTRLARLSRETHARVEDRIRCAKDTGLGRFPSRHAAINAVWLELALAGIDLLAWTQTSLLTGDLARAEPKAIRYRLLHAAARITRGQRRTYLRLPAHWPWARALAQAFATLARIPAPLPSG